MSVFFIFFTSVLSFSQVQVFPTRLTLTDQQTSSYINLKNPSDHEETYQIELVQFQMKPDGSFSKMEIPSASHPLTDRLKFSPTKISLGPGEKQVVRVMSLQTSDLPDGEIYLYLRASPEQTKETKSSDTSGGFHLNARIAVAVPVVVRHGKVQADPRIDRAFARPSKDGSVDIGFELKKVGNGFIYGDLEIFAGEGEKKKTIATVKGVSSYIDSRKFGSVISAKEIETEGVKDLSQWRYRFQSNTDSATAFDLSGTFEVEKESSVLRKKKR